MPTVDGSADTEPGIRQGRSEAREGALSGLRVLVVDDNAINLLVATRLLNWLGCVVEVRSDGLSAVERALGSELDAVLMDLHMPNMDGYEATTLMLRRLHGAGRAPPPVFALTADAIEGVAERCVAHGMRGLIPKPVTRDMLMHHLQALL